MSGLSPEQYQFIQQIFANLSVAAFAIDPDHKVILWNSACEQLTGGLTAEEVIGSQDHWKGFYADPRPCLADTLLSDGLEGALKIYPHVSASEAVEGGLHAENWCVNRRGEKLYLLFEAGPIRDGEGNVLAVLETLRDTTQPKLLNDIREAVGAVTRFAMEADSLVTLLEQTLDLIHASPWLTVEPKGSVHLVDLEHPDRLLLAANKDLDPELIHACRVIPLGHCLCGKAAEKGAIIFTQEVDAAHEVQYDGMASHGHYCVPIQSQSRTLGVLNTYTPTGHQASPGERIFLENVAQALANGIEKWRAEWEIKKTKESLTRAQQIARMGSWHWMIQDDQLRFSDESLRLLGLSPETGDLPMEEFLSRLPTAERERMESALASVLNQGEPEYALDHMVIRSDGSERVVHAMGKVSRDAAGQAVQMEGVMLDITQRKRAEEATQILGRVLGGSMNAIYIFDSRSLKFLQVSEGARRTLGYTSRELSNMSFLDLAFDLDATTFAEKMEQVREYGEERVIFETTLRGKKGEARPVEVRLQLSDAEQPPVFVAVATSTAQRQKEKERLHRLAHYDALTGLPNRMLFRERLEQGLAHGKRNGKTLAVMFLDLDKFKAVNDTLGHDAGDLLLKEVSTRLSGCLREIDTVARLGGDEFTIILDEVASREGVTLVAEKVIELMRTPFQLGEHVAEIGTSIGISLFPENGETPETLIKKADQAMYAVKQSGRNAFRYFEPKMGERA